MHDRLLLLQVRVSVRVLPAHTGLKSVGLFWAMRRVAKIATGRNLLIEEAYVIFLLYRPWLSGRVGGNQGSREFARMGWWFVRQIGWVNREPSGDKSHGGGGEGGLSGPFCVLGEAMATVVQRHESGVGCRLPCIYTCTLHMAIYIQAQGKVEQEESLWC
jgi:hypothetical protein